MSGADDIGAMVSIEDGAIGAADEAGAIVSTADEAIDSMVETADDATASTDEATGAADEEATGATDDEATGTTGVAVLLRLKMKIRPMMTITATMMMIQVLRFMRLTLGFGEVEGKIMEVLTLGRFPYPTASNPLAVIGGVQRSRAFALGV